MVRREDGRTEESFAIKEIGRSSHGRDCYITVQSIPVLWIIYS
jgi:hypothetical protein